MADPVLVGTWPQPVAMRAIVHHVVECPGLSSTPLPNALFFFK